MMMAGCPDREDGADTGAEAGGAPWRGRQTDWTHRKESVVHMAAGSYGIRQQGTQAGGERAVNTTDPRHQAGLGRAQIWVLRYIDQICSV